MPELLRHGFVHRQLEKIHDHLEAIVASRPETEHGAKVPPQVFTQLREAVQDARADQEDPGAAPYYSRHPVVNLAQAALHERLEEKRARGEVEHDDERMGDPYTKADIGWVVEIALALGWRMVFEKYPFCDAPAEHPLEDKVRLVLFSDWGTGRQGAEHVRDQARHWIDGSERPVHVIHLGDVYYAGLEREVRENVLRLWPVPEDRAREVPSWALNGNHDMYSGGHGFFETLLGDPRFALQRANGGPTSWFSLQSPSWNVVGLDTAWDDHLPFQWRLGHLYGSQSDHVAARAADADRRLLLLSHHQLFTVHDDDKVGEKIERALRGVLEGRGVDVWFWGHEHDCIAYHPHGGVRAARAIGHGAVPVVVGGEQSDTPDHVAWQFREYRIGSDGGHWAKHGFAVLDLDGDQMVAHHVDDEGNVYREEQL